MYRQSRWALLVTVMASSLVLAYCSGDTPADQTQQPGNEPPDAGPECLSVVDCTFGNCVNGKCMGCNETGCPAGQGCSATDGLCHPCDASVCDGVDAGPKKCQTRRDCDATEACRQGVCLPPDPSGACSTSDNCKAGYVCSNHACVQGCLDDQDCVLSGLGVRCDTSTLSCVPCAKSTDCQNGQLCVNGACKAAPSCTGSDRTPCGDYACIGGTCSPCTNAGQCGTNMNCTNGKCEQISGCTSDQECQGITPGHFCNQAQPRACEWGCLAGTGAACGQNCCSTNEQCNTTSHQCEPKACNNCNNSCTGGRVCDTNSCTCVQPTGTDAGIPGGTDGGGGFGDPCDSSCACGGGNVCVCAFGNCDPFQCALGFGFCFPP